MAKKTIEIGFDEAASQEGGLVELVYSVRWLHINGIDSQKPIYITPDYVKRIFYINGWEIKDANLET